MQSSWVQEPQDLPRVAPCSDEGSPRSAAGMLGRFRFGFRQERRFGISRRHAMQAEAGVADTPAIWGQDILRKTGGKIDELVVDMVTTRSSQAIHFLSQDIGIPIHLMLAIPIVGTSCPVSTRRRARMGATSPVS